MSKMKSETRRPKLERKPKAEIRKLLPRGGNPYLQDGSWRSEFGPRLASGKLYADIRAALIKPTGPLQTCGDLPKKRKIANHKSPTAMERLVKGKLVVVLVTPEEIREVHEFLRAAQWKANHIRLVPLMQGIARGWLLANE
jgi:hypothetical protein